MIGKNKLIAKNTALLYFRLLFSMIVSLYTSRVVLSVLGVEDFGIYNIVGGVVVMFTFINEAMVSSTQRFINFEIGKNDLNKVSKIFSMSLSIHIGIAVIILILAETFGLWFLNNKLNIPLHRNEAANWVYQFTVLGTVVGILRVPYNASIIAFERISFYAYYSIVEVILRLLLVYILILDTIDKLILYSFLVTIVGLITLISYKLYCNIKFQTCRYVPEKNKNLFNEMASFSGWNLVGGISSMGASQGVNIIVNLFYGVSLNAAIGIANNVNLVVYQFVQNFQTALNPQLIKSYANGQLDYFFSLIIRGSKFSFFLLFLIILPLILNLEVILDLWLEDVPEYTVVFTRLLLITLLIDSLNGPLWVSVQAIGDIKIYQIVFSFLLILNFPLSYFFLERGHEPYIIVLISFGIKFLATLFRIIYLHKKVSFPIKSYLLKAIFPILFVAFFSTIFPLLLGFYYDFNWVIDLLSSVITSSICVIIFVYFFGLTFDEKIFLKKTIKNKLSYYFV